jgi:hypothetical protein
VAFDTDHPREDAMTRAFIGWVVLGTAVGFALGAALVLVGGSTPNVLAITDEPERLRSGTWVVGGISALVGALVGAAAAVAGEWWPVDER